MKKFEKKRKILLEAEKHIKKIYVDHDHCAQSARAVKSFIEGVIWCLSET